MSLNEIAVTDHEEVESKRGELNDLLGGSDDESKGGNELNDLLGNSDDDSDHDKDFSTKDNGIQNISNSNGEQAETRSNELDQILGKADSKFALKDQKAKTKSRVLLPSTYKVASDDVSVFVRTPNFIKIQAEEYDEALYDGMVDAERKEFDGSTAVVRWRLKRDENGEVVLDSTGKPVKESNARMIQWSDGSVQLVVGDAVFQCKNVDVDNCYVYEQQNVYVSSVTDAAADGKKDILECIGSIHHRLVLQPTSLDSESHARMSMKISEKHKKESKIRDRDYELITEKPEKTIANLARLEEEKMRREKKVKDRQFTGGNTITGAARYIRRPAMSAEYLAAGGYDDEMDGEAEELPFERVDRERAQQKAKGAAAAVKAPKQAPKKKGPVSNDYLEYDDDGSEMEDEDEEENSAMEDDDDDEEEDEGDEEEEEEGSDEAEEEESEAEGGGSDSDGSAAAKKKLPKKDKKERKEARKLRKAEKRARKEEKRLNRSKRHHGEGKEGKEASRPKQQQEHQQKKKRPVEQDENDDERAEGSNNAAGSARDAAGGAAGSDDEDEVIAVQQRKRIKRTILDSDDDE